MRLHPWQRQGSYPLFALNKWGIFAWTLNTLLQESFLTCPLFNFLECNALLLRSVYPIIRFLTFWLLQHQGGTGCTAFNPKTSLAQHVKVSIVHTARMLQEFKKPIFTDGVRLCRDFQLEEKSEVKQEPKLQEGCWEKETVTYKDTISYTSDFRFFFPRVWP